MLNILFYFIGGKIIFSNDCTWLKYIPCNECTLRVVVVVGIFWYHGLRGEGGADKIVCTPFTMGKSIYALSLRKALPRGYMGYIGYML